MICLVYEKMSEEKVELRPVAVTGEEPLPKGYYAYLEDLDTHKKYLIPYGTWTIGRKADGVEVDIPVETCSEKMSFISKKQGILTLKRNLIGENALYLRDSEEVANPSAVEGFAMNRFFDYQILHEDVVRLGATFFRVYLHVDGAK